MNDIMNQIGMCRTKAMDLEQDQPGAANLLRMNANKMEELLEVAESAKVLRDYCKGNLGTPPNLYVCDLDDDLTELDKGELEEAEAYGPCLHNDWYETSGWRFCRQCIRHWDAEFMYDHIPATAKAMVARYWGERVHTEAKFQGLCAPAENILTVKQAEESLTAIDRINRVNDLEAACEAARAFIDQYSYVITNDDYRAVWAFMGMHNNPYKGPLFKDPTALRAALEKVEHPLRVTSHE